MPRPERMTWTPRLDKLIAELYLVEAASVIAARIGTPCTTQSVHARAARLGLRKNGRRHVPNCLSSDLRALLAKLGDQGLAVDELALHRVERAQGASALARMARRGHISVLRPAHARTRYFIDGERAATWLRLYHKPVVQQRAVRPFVGAGPNADNGPVRRAWWPADAPMHITLDTKFTRCPGFTGNPTRTNTHASST